MSTVRSTDALDGSTPVTLQPHAAAGGPGPERAQPFSARVRELVIRTLPIIAVVVVWQVLTSTIFDRPRIYPPPTDVWDELVRILSGEGPLGSTYGHAWATLYRLGTAFVVAFVIGSLAGVVAGRRKWLFDVSDNLVWIAMTVPSVVWVFIFVIALGISDLIPIFALITLLAPPVFISVAEGAKSISPDLVTMARSYKVDRWQRLTGLYLPSVVPYMAASARVTFALGIKIVIIAEVIGLPNGVGLLIKYWTDTLFMAPVVAWGILLTAIGIIFDRFVFGPLERRAAGWVSGDANRKRKPKQVGMQ